MESHDSERESGLETEYYYSTPGRPALGPCTLAQLRVLWMSGHIVGDTPLWQDGMSAWLPSRDIPAVAAALQQLPQPPQLAAAGELWFCADSDSARPRGGLTTQQVGVLLQNGEIDGLTQVWRQGMAEWCELGKIDELKAVLIKLEPDDQDHEAAHAAQAWQEQQFEAFDPSDELDPLPSTKLPDKAAMPDGRPSRPSPAAEGAKPKRVRKKAPKFVQDGRSNIYVNGIPPSAGEEELVECFKVAGLLKTDPSTGRPRIKRYMDEQGRPKQDALITFLKPESVPLAVTLRDGFEMQPGAVLTVQPAKFEMRGEVNIKQHRFGKDEMLLRKKQKLVEQRQLAQWEDGLLTGADGKRQCTVVLFGLFSTDEAAAADAAFYANRKQDVEVECRKAGEIEKVTLFEGSERGAAAVRFKTADDAEKCVAMMNERQFGTSQLSCELYDGVSDYRVKPACTVLGEGAAGTAMGDGAESVEDQMRNLDGFAEWLEADSTDEEVEAED